MPPFLRRAFRRVVAATRLFPFSFLGLFVLGASLVLVLHFGLERLDLVLLVLGALGLLLCAITLLGVVGTALWLRRALRGGLSKEGACEGECGYGLWTGFSLPRPWTPLVRVGWAWDSPAARVRIHRRPGRLYEEVVLERRVRVHTVTRIFEVADVFGLCNVRFSVRRKQSLRVVPSKG
ncbi:MAG: hypothetical protein KC416_11725, partial [Myxococcales bacterium]|nr:hypothetical protein [Myxococcales bacterium]